LFLGVFALIGSSSWAQEIAGSGLVVVDRKSSDEPLRITKVHPGSPAEKAGIKLFRGYLISVDGTNVVALEISKAVSLLRGPAGTPVAVEIADMGRETTNRFTLKRQKMALQGDSVVFSG